MKIRTDFVTNSSSSSYIISTNKELPEKYKEDFTLISDSNSAMSIMKERYSWIFDYEDKQLVQQLKELGNLTEEQIPVALLLYHNYFNDYVSICDKLKNVNEPIYHICVDRDWLYHQWELRNFLKEVTIIDEEGDL